MAITTCIPDQAKQDLLDGVHASGDTYKIALFQTSATLGASSATYSTTGECPGTGNYAQGGISMVGRANAIASNTAYLDWTTDPSWASATITAGGCVIYNSSKTNKILAIFSFGGDVSSTNGTFTVQLPAAAYNTAIIRLG